MLTFKKKFAAAFLFLLFFSITYSIVARLPRYAAIDLTTPIDNALPLISWFMLFYLLAYILPLAAFLTAETKQELKLILKTFILMLLVASIIFLAFPVAIQHQEITTTDVFSRMLIFLRRQLDNQWNAFPSFHVASAFLTSLIIREKKSKYSIPIFIIAFLIIISTLFTKQHLILDVLAGLILATGFYFYYLYSLKKSKRVSSTFQ